MLDTVTLRVTFGVVALTVLALFYAATYRSTRSPYCGWWCAALALFVVGALLFVANGTVAQVVANPLGNAVSVAGAAAVWAAARSLRELPLPWWHLALAPVVVLAASLLDDPADDVWTGGAVFLLGMAAMIGAAARELTALARVREDRHRDHQHHAAVVAMAWMAGTLALYYLLRAVAFVAVGPDHDLFRSAFGSQTTTLLTLVMLVVVTYTMALLTQHQATSELRAHATRDGLTGLLNRRELVLRLEAALHDESAAEVAVLIADLDDFKLLNDLLGHAAGDHALAVFAEVAEAALRPGDCVGRLGGDEFVLLLRDGRRAEEVAAEVRGGYGRRLGPAAGATVSMGIAQGYDGATAGDLLHRADVALYRAKAAGRDRAVRWTEADGPQPPAERRTVRRG